MIREDFDSLKQQFLNNGYDLKLVEMAIKYSKDKNEDSVTDYIHKYNNAIKESVRRECVKQTEKNKNASNNDTIPKKLESSRVKYEETKNISKNFEENYQQSQIDKVKVIESKKEELKNVETYYDCRIRVRFENRDSELISFNKSESLLTLFNEIKIRMGSNSFKVYTADYKKIEKRDINFIQAGFYPSKALFVKKSGFSFFN